MSHKPQYTEHHAQMPDSWHLHSADEGQPQVEHAGKVNTVVLAGALLGSLAFVAVVILITYMYFQVYMTSKRRDLIENTALSAAYHEYRDASKAQLGGFSFADEASARAGKATVPIEQAKQNVIARYSAAGGGKN